MSVVNVKVAFIRPKYNDLKEWCEDSDNVYIARAGVVFIKDTDGNKARYPPHSSTWANPFKISKTETREDVILKYEKYIRERLENEEGLVEELLSLKSKRLGCWCSPLPCHGDLILRLIEEYS
jgi:hypothetical protein